MNKLTNKSALWWLLLLATVPSFISLLREGFFPMHDDLPVFRQYAMEECLKDGQIPCRWTKELGYGYGYPLMNFYPPLPYLMGFIPRAMGLSFLDTTKLLFILGLVISAGFMARLGSLFFDRWGTVAGALFFLYGPYHAVDLYVRGDLNESWAIAFFPAILWASYKVIKRPNLKNVILLALSYAAILLSHLGMALIMTPVLFVWCLLWLVLTRKQGFQKKFKGLVLSGLFAVFFSAFFIIPVVFEQQFVHVETLTMGYFNFLAHFVDLNQLFFSRFWGYGASVYGPGDGMSFQIGIAHWTIGLAASLGLVTWWRKSRELALAFIFFLLLFLGATFMAHWKATPIWLMLPKLEFLQFPWRLLAIILPAISFLAASAVQLIPSRGRGILVVGLFIILLLLYGNYFRPETWWPDRTDQTQFSGQVWQKALTAGIFDYLPKWSKAPPGKAAPQNASLLANGAVVTLIKKSNSQEYLVDNQSTKPANLQINTLYYSGWEGSVNDKPTPITVAGPEQLGLINFSVPPGKNLVKVLFKETPTRLFSDFISLTSWVVILAWILTQKVGRRSMSAASKGAI